MKSIPMTFLNGSVLLLLTCLITGVLLIGPAAGDPVSATFLPDPTISLVPAYVTVDPGETREFQLVVDNLPAGLAGYRLFVALSDSRVGQVIAVSYPAWAVLNNTTGVSSGNVRMSAVDLNRQVEPGASGIILGSFTLRADRPGHTVIVVQVTQMDADGGDRITPGVETAELHVEEPAPEPPVAAFTAFPRSGGAPLEVHFTDLSTGSSTRWAWDFDSDGTIDSTEKDPTHTYGNPGQYGVALTVTNAGGTDSEYKSGYITARAIPDQTGTIRGWVGSGSEYGLFGVPGIRVRVATTTENLRYPGGYYEATTDNRGCYTLAGLPSGMTLYAMAFSPEPYPDLYAERPVQYQVNSGSLVTCGDTWAAPIIPALVPGHDTQLNWVLTRKTAPGFFFF